MKKLLSGVMVFGLVNSSFVWAAGNDELWEVTSKMEMPGMPFAMPGHTSRICIKKGNENDPKNAIPKDKDQDCKMTDIRISGNTSSWKMKCAGEHPMAGSGEMTRGDGTYKGKMKMHSEDGDMMMTYEGRRIGTCQAKR